MTGRPTPPPFDQPRRRRRFSLWTLLAPAALIVIVIMVFNALGESCLVRECERTAEKTTTTADGPKVDPNVKRHRVKEGETAEVIASKYGISVADLAACNRKIGDIYILQVDQMVTVHPKRCKGAGEDAI